MQEEHLHKEKVMAHKTKQQQQQQQKITTKTHAKTNQKYERTDNIHNACNVTSVTVT